MAQELIKMNNTVIKQPDKDMAYNFTTKNTQDSQRTQDGAMHTTSVYTVETLTYKASLLSVSEMSTILQIVARGEKFTMHYFSPFYGMWRTDTFYVGKGNLSIGRLNENKELFSSLTFTAEGVNPI